MTPTPYQLPGPRFAPARPSPSPTMDLDIEMDVDVDDIQALPQIPEAYTQDIITGEEQVRTGFLLPPGPLRRLLLTRILSVGTW